MNTKNKHANGIALRELLEQLNLTQPAALDMLNAGQTKPMALRTFKTYLADVNSRSWHPCPDAVLNRLRELANRKNPTLG